MAKAVKVPQTYVYAAKIPAAKKIKALTFRSGVPMVVHDPRLVRLLDRLPYMKKIEETESPAMVKARKPMAKAAAAEIPADWQDQHHKRRKAWAKELSGSEVTDLAEADRIIAGHMGASVSVPEVEPVQTQELVEA